MGPYRQAIGKPELDLTRTIHARRVAVVSALLGSAELVRGGRYLADAPVGLVLPSAALAVLGALSLITSDASRRQRIIAGIVACANAVAAFVVGLTLLLRHLDSSGDAGFTAWLVRTHAESIAAGCSILLLAAVARRRVRRLAVVLALLFVALWLVVWASEERLLLGVGPALTHALILVLAVVVIAGAALWLMTSLDQLPSMTCEWHACDPVPYGLDAILCSFRDGRAYLAVSGQDERGFADVVDALLWLDRNGFVETERSPEPDGADDAEGGSSSTLFALSSLRPASRWAVAAAAWVGGLAVLMSAAAWLAASMDVPTRVAERPPLADAVRAHETPVALPSGWALPPPASVANAGNLKIVSWVPPAPLPPFNSRAWRDPASSWSSTDRTLAVLDAVVTSESLRALVGARPELDGLGRRAEKEHGRLVQYEHLFHAGRNWIEVVGSSVCFELTPDQSAINELTSTLALEFSPFPATQSLADAVSCAERELAKRFGEPLTYAGGATRFVGLRDRGDRLAWLIAFDASQARIDATTCECFDVVGSPSR